MLFLAYRRVGPCSLVSCFRFSQGFPLDSIILFDCFPTIFPRLGTHLSAAPCHPASMTGEAGPIYPSLPRPQAQMACKGDGDTGGFVAWVASHNGNPWFSPFFSLFFEVHTLRPASERILEPQILTDRGSALVPNSRIDRTSSGQECLHEACL